MKKIYMDITLNFFLAEGMKVEEINALIEGAEMRQTDNCNYFVLT